MVSATAIAEISDDSNDDNTSDVDNITNSTDGKVPINPQLFYLDGSNQAQGDTDFSLRRERTSSKEAWDSEMPGNKDSSCSVEPFDVKDTD